MTIRRKKDTPVRVPSRNKRASERTRNRDAEIHRLPRQNAGRASDDRRNGGPVSETFFPPTPA